MAKRTKQYNAGYQAGYSAGHNRASQYASKRGDELRRKRRSGGSGLFGF